MNRKIKIISEREVRFLLEFVRYSLKKMEFY